MASLHPHDNKFEGRGNFPSATTTSRAGRYGVTSRSVSASSGVKNGADAEGGCVPFDTEGDGDTVAPLRAEDDDFEGCGKSPFSDNDFDDGGNASRHPLRKRTTPSTTV